VGKTRPWAHGREKLVINVRKVREEKGLVVDQEERREKEAFAQSGVP